MPSSDEPRPTGALTSFTPKAPARSVSWRIVRHEAPLVVLFHGNYLGLAKAEDLARQRAARSPQAVVREQRALPLADQAALPRETGTPASVAVRQSYPRRSRSRTPAAHTLSPRRVMSTLCPTASEHKRVQTRAAHRYRAALGLPEGFTILSAGRLTRDKSETHACRGRGGARRRWSRTPSARLDILGDGAEAGALETLPAGLGLGDRVTPSR